MRPNQLMSFVDMRKIALGHMLRATAQLERVEVLLEDRKRREDFDPHTSLPPKTRNIIAAHYSHLATSAEAMGASIAAKSATRAVKKLRARKNPVTFAELGIVSAELQNVFNDQLQEVEFYCLPTGSSKYYAPENPIFGAEVDARIPEANDDILEAGKCFAVGRYTASVFHLMRAMECGVQRIADELDIKDLDRVWGNLLSDIGRAIEALPKGAKRDSWSATMSLLYHVKQAWRNKTMHPKRTYTEEEAREVFEAVRAFMRHLASLLPPGAEGLMS